MRRRGFIIGIILFSLILAAGGLYFVFAWSAHAASDPEREAGVFDPLLIRPLYRLAIDFAYDSHRARISQAIEVTNRTGEKWERLVLAVPPAVNPAVFSLESCTVVQHNRTFLVRPEIKGSMLICELDNPINHGDEIRVKIDYELELRKLEPWEIHPAGNLGYNDKVTQFGDFIPTLTPFEQGRGFQEWEYIPVGDPYAYSVADFIVDIITDEGVTVAAAGLVTHYENLWQFRLEKARTFAFTASKRYDFFSTTARDIPIYCYFIKGNEHAANVMLECARQSIELYSDLYGPYPYRELVLAQNAFASAMEYSGFITISNTNIENYSDTAPQLLLYLVAHETSHQWWYGAVGNNQVTEPWLDESLAKYSELLYFHTFHPELTEWWQSLTVVQWPQDRFIDDTIYEFRDTPRDYTRVIYGLSPLFIQELHQLVGEKAFFDFLKEYRAYGENRFVTKKDFFTILGHHTEQDISPLLRKYFRFPP